jgi:hypothetical protein
MTLEVCYNSIYKYQYITACIYFQSTRWLKKVVLLGCNTMKPRIDSKCDNIIGKPHNVHKLYLDLIYLNKISNEESEINFFMFYQLNL